MQILCAKSHHISKHTYVRTYVIDSPHTISITRSADRRRVCIRIQNHAKPVGPPAHTHTHTSGERALRDYNCKYMTPLTRRVDQTMTGGEWFVRSARSMRGRRGGLRDECTPEMRGRGRSPRDGHHRWLLGCVTECGNDVDTRAPGRRV